MSITTPLLPPRAGYVEVVDENGNHIYKPTQATLEEQEKEKQAAETQQIVTDILGGDSNAGNETQAALEFNRAVQLYVSSIEDETTILSIPSVYPEYKVGTAYKTKDIFRYGTNSVGDPQLYQVLQDHTSAAEWTPDSATSLYKKIGISEDGTPVWVQPLGATDAYALGDVVLYNGKKYKSLIDANVWSPDVYPRGWELVEETTEPDPSPEPEPEPTPEPGGEEIPEFVQPSGAHDAYKSGDIVMYNGKKYQSTIDNNVWSPDAYPQGWEEIV